MTPATTMRGTAPRMTRVISQLFMKAIVKPAPKVNRFWNIIKQWQRHRDIVSGEGIEALQNSLESRYVLKQQNDEKHMYHQKTD